MRESLIFLNKFLEVSIFTNRKEFSVNRNNYLFGYFKKQRNVAKLGYLRNEYEKIVNIFGIRRM